MTKVKTLILTAIILPVLLIGGNSAQSVHAASVNEESVIKPLAFFPEDTDLISIWRVANGGYIYSPVSVTSYVSIYSTTSGSNLLATKRELVSKTFLSAWDVYPNATFGPGILNIRGSNVSLPNYGSYLSDPNWAMIGKYNDTQALYSSTSGSGYGQSVFVGGSGSFQVDTTGQVDFTW